MTVDYDVLKARFTEVTPDEKYRDSFDQIIALLRTISEAGMSDYDISCRLVDLGMYHSSEMKNFDDHLKFGFFTEAIGQLIIENNRIMRSMNNDTLPN
jgi:hypothetical protein